MKINIRKFKLTDKKEISILIQKLYEEDSFGKKITAQKIDKTIKELFLHPEKGSIFVIIANDLIIGYALIIYYWSNEYGGNIINLDELYILPQYRRKKIGTNFINYLIKNKINSSFAIQLEVTQNNKIAKKFYDKLGFNLSDRIHLFYDNYKIKKNKNI